MGRGGMTFNDWVEVAYPNRKNDRHSVYFLDDMRNAYLSGIIHGDFFKRQRKEKRMENEFTKKEENGENVNQSVNQAEIKTEGTESPAEHKGGKAKMTSLVAQTIAAVWVAVWSGVKFLNGGGDVSDIIFSGFAIAACFSPVYFNMILDKIRDIKFGGRNDG